MSCILENPVVMGFFGGDSIYRTQDSENISAYYFFSLYYERKFIGTKRNDIIDCSEKQIKLNMD